MLPSQLHLGTSCFCTKPWLSLVGTWPACDTLICKGWILKCVHVSVVMHVGLEIFSRTPATSAAALVFAQQCAILFDGGACHLMYLQESLSNLRHEFVVCETCSTQQMNVPAR